MPVFFPVWPLWWTGRGGSIHFRHVALGNKIKASGKAQTPKEHPAGSLCRVQLSKSRQGDHKHLPAPPAAQSPRCPDPSKCCWDIQVLPAKHLNQAAYSKNSFKSTLSEGCWTATFILRELWHKPCNETISGKNLKKEWVCLQFYFGFSCEKKSGPLGAEWNTQWLIRAGPILYSSIWTCHFFGCFISIFPLTSQDLFQNACSGTSSSKYILYKHTYIHTHICTAKSSLFPLTNHSWRQKIIDGQTKEMVKGIYCSVNTLFSVLSGRAVKASSNTQGWMYAKMVKLS